MLNLTIKTPDKEFTQVMETFLGRMQGAQKDGVNARMLDINIKVYQNTPVADRAAIESKLGAIMEFGRFNRRTGAFRRFKRARTTVVEGFSLAYAIVQKRFKDRAGVYLPVAVAKAEAVKLIRSVVRSVGFIRSGWIPGLKRLNAVVRGGGKTVTSGLNDVRGQAKGWAYPATTLDNPTAEIANTTKVASEIAGPALSEAIEQSKAWMESKMREDIEKVAQANSGGRIG